MIASLIFRRSIRYFYRLVKPSISEFKSLQQLQYDQSQRQLAMLQNFNTQTLLRNKTFTKQKLISSLLNTSQQITSHIAKRHLNFSAISPKSLKHHTLEQGFADGKIDYPFLLEELEIGLPDCNQIPMHFSYKRGVPIINEYDIDKKTAYVFNLPEDFNTKEISQKLGIETIKQVKVEYDRLGLPAYAKVYFNNDEAVTNLVLNNKTYVEIGGRVCFIKTHFDKEKLQLKNRRLVIQDLEQDESELIFKLSQYGRVLHLDYPTFISLNPSIQQIRQKYADSEQLVKINFHRKDGSIDHEYYPSLQDSLKLHTTGNTQDIDANIIEKKQKIQAIYKSRTRYAQEVDVYEGKQSQANIQNMRYCIVTFSCVEQAQNCYFGMRWSNKVKLFDQKQTEEFEVDELYRKRILRFIDAEYRKTKDQLQNSKSVYEKELEDYFDELSLFDKLIDMETTKRVLKEQTDEFDEDQPQVLISYFNTRVNEIKKGLTKKLGSHSFDELAEKQLFGRVLPKTDRITPKMNLDVLPEAKPAIKEVMEGNVLKKLNTTTIKSRDAYYHYLKNRQTRRDRMAEKHEADEGQEGQEGGEDHEAVQEAQEGEGEEFTGQRNFSTAKKRTTAFRPRTSLQLANYILRYCEYIRDIINEYQGIFPQHRFTNTTKQTFLNPEGLTFNDGTQFVTEDDLPKFLQCMRKFDDAQKTYEDFWKDYEIWKSKSIDLNQYKNLIRNYGIEAVQKYADHGVVKEVYEVEQGEDIDKKVLYLNATVAGFGQEFRVHEDENGKVIVKVTKVETICPIDRLTKIAQAKDKFDAQYTPSDKKQQLFNKYKYQIIETGQIPEQVRKQFDIPSDKTLDDLFEELASEAGIYKKDIEMLLNLENFTQDQIGEAVGLQIQLQKARVAQRQASASDFAKDPSNIEVRDKEGFFKVSKYRQI